MQSRAILLLLIFISGCNQEKIATETSAAYKKAIGHWQLMTITSAWTGQVSMPSSQIEMVITPQAQGIIYENGKAVQLYTYTLEGSPSLIFRYTITRQNSVSPIGFSSGAIFQVSHQELIISDAPTDGGTYRFERKK